MKITTMETYDGHVVCWEEEKDYGQFGHLPASTPVMAYKKCIVLLYKKLKKIEKEATLGI